MKASSLILIILLATPLLAADIGTQTPYYIDCQPDRVILYPGGTNVTWETLQQPDNPVVELLDQIQAHTESKYLVILARPQSVKFFQEVRILALRCHIDIDVAYEAVDADSIIDEQHLPKINKPERPPASCSGGLIRKLIDQQFIGMHAVLYECRKNEVFYIDRSGLDAQVDKLMSTPATSHKRDQSKFDAFEKMVKDSVITNESYKVLTEYLLQMVIALEPQANVHGESLDQFNGRDSKFQTALAHLDPNSQYIYFFVRDNGFKAYHSACPIAEKLGLKTSLDLVETGKPIMLGYGIP